MAKPVKKGKKLGASKLDKKLQPLLRTPQVKIPTVKIPTVKIP